LPVNSKIASRESKKRRIFHDQFRRARTPFRLAAATSGQPGAIHAKPRSPAASRTPVPVWRPFAVDILLNGNIFILL
jgi:hypothetical protein